jgi:quercetin dioxygenase-like cupin family protein
MKPNVAPVGWIKAASARPPDFVIGGPERPYLKRWYLTPRNDVGCTYLHCILRDDDDRALHDHPWDNTSIVLAGELREITPEGGFTLRAGDVVTRRAEDRHRLEVVAGPVWTLFLTGPKRREWGFWCSQGFVPWQQFVDPTDSGKVGPGCGGEGA